MDVLAGGEPQLAVHGGRVFVPRLVRVAADEGDLTENDRERVWGPGGGLRARF